MDFVIKYTLVYYPLKKKVKLNKPLSSCLEDSCHVCACSYFYGITHTHIYTYAFLCCIILNIDAINFLINQYGE